MIERIESKSCCGQKSIFLKLDAQVTNLLLSELAKNGYIEYRNFTATGILYAYNKDLIVTGGFGTTRLQVKCKTSRCNESLDILEDIIKRLYGESSSQGNKEL